MYDEGYVLAQDIASEVSISHVYGVTLWQYPFRQFSNGIFLRGKVVKPRLLS